MEKQVVWRKCGDCSKKFAWTGGRKKYCSGACRFNAWYKRVHEVDGVAIPCVYCGLAADTKDHIPPQAYRPFLESVGEKRYPFLLVPACKECNSALGAKALWTVHARKEWIKRRLERKYKHYLAIPGWEDGEVRELGPSLSQEVIRGLAIRDVTRRRIAW